MRQANEQQSLDEIASEIRVAIQVGDKAVNRGIGQYVRAGHLLFKARSLCKHGDWGNWLRKNIPYSQQRASEYMRLAKAEVEFKLPPSGNLSGNLKEALQAIVDVAENDELDDDESNSDPPSEPPSNGTPKSPRRKRATAKPNSETSKLHFHQQFDSFIDLLDGNNYLDLSLWLDQIDRKKAEMLWKASRIWAKEQNLL